MAVTSPLRVNTCVTWPSGAKLRVQTRGSGVIRRPDGRDVQCTWTVSLQSACTHAVTLSVHDTSDVVVPIEVLRRVNGSGAWWFHVCVDRLDHTQQAELMVYARALLGDLSGSWTVHPPGTATADAV